MYKSPIEKIYGEMQTQMTQEDEKLTMKAIRNVGVNVDKEALIKALEYDRNQYTKGYEDGKKDIIGKIRAELIDAIQNGTLKIESGHDMLFHMIDAYKAESKDN